MTQFDNSIIYLLGRAKDLMLPSDANEIILGQPQTFMFCRMIGPSAETKPTTLVLLNEEGRVKDLSLHSSLVVDLSTGNVPEPQARLILDIFSGEVKARKPDLERFTDG